MFDSDFLKYGNVTGPAAATNNAVALWNGTTGQLLKNSSTTLPASGFLGDIVGPGASTNNGIVVWDGTSGRLVKNSTSVLPVSAIVGTTDTQTITNKSVTIVNNTALWASPGSLIVPSNAAGGADAGGGAFMTFLRNGSFGMNLGMDTDNVFKLSGYSLGSVIPWSVTKDGVMAVNRTIYFRAPYVLTATTAATTVDFNLGQKVHLVLNISTTVTFTFPGPGNYQILLIQDGTGNRTVTWAAGNNNQYVGSASAPAINLVSGGMTMVNIYWSGSGSFIAVAKVNAA